VARTVTFKEMNGLFASLIRHKYCADVRQCNLRMFVRSHIRKLPVTTSAHPHFTPGLCMKIEQNTDLYQFTIDGRLLFCRAALTLAVPFMRF